MVTTTIPTSVRLTSAERRRIAAAARRRGLSVAGYIKRAALFGTQSSDVKLARLERLAAGLLDAVEDERDVRIGDARWERHLKEKTRLYTGEEAWRELGLQD